MAILFTGEDNIYRQVPTHTFKDEKLRRLNVFWEDGALMVDDYDDTEGRDLAHEFNACTLWLYLDSGCEIVGHVSTEPPPHQDDEDEDEDND